MFAIIISIRFWQPPGEGNFSPGRPAREGVVAWITSGLVV
jgi:hypothetical protein